MSPPFPPTWGLAKFEGKFHVTLMTPTSFCGFCLQHCRVRVEVNCNAACGCPAALRTSGSVSGRSFALALLTVNANMVRILLLPFRHSEQTHNGHKDSTS
jgi:hypothetical protein